MSGTICAAAIQHVATLAKSFSNVSKEELETQWELGMASLGEPTAQGRTADEAVANLPPKQFDGELP